VLCEYGDSIILDPYDVFRMMKNLETSFEGLMKEYVELSVYDGLILPHLKMDGKMGKCSFLNEEGRCSIHEFRPGFCRLFPLGRIYEDGTFHYFSSEE
jgi:Fe-S-cluster containining protein